MSESSNDNLPKNPIEAQGELIKAFYEKFGSDSLEIIKKILGRQGRSLGLKIKKKIPDGRLSTVAKAFSKSYDPKLIKIVSISDEEFHIQGFKCPFGLENTARELCEAAMEIDREYFFTATNGKTDLKILKTRAAGDEICDTIYLIKKE
ncbi:MAG: hypothetical protein ACTSVY_12030 [Candidatus Helarchaeota archaeon]